MIVERIIEEKARHIKQWPVKSNRASELGHPCIRYHVLNRTRWQEKTLHDVGLQFVFDLGHEIEEIALKDLRAAGFTILENQRAFEWPEYNITGSIDGKVMIDDKAYPLEIKSCSPFVFESIHTIQDIINHKYPYMRKYPAQLTIYLLMSGIDKGVFLFKNKTTGAYREIWMDLDYDLGETLIKRAESINTHVAAGTLPDCINDDKWCDGCGFAHICLPDRVGKEVEMIDDSELEGLISKYEKLKPLAKQYKDIDEQIKNAVNGREKIMVGDFFITGKFISDKRSKEPYWKREIMNFVTGSKI
jgi:CRISPR/Cas system-associated exonuclease Cas4 (RecB family)